MQATVWRRETFPNHYQECKTNSLIPCLASTNGAVSAVLMASWLLVAANTQGPSLTMTICSSDQQTGRGLKNSSRFNGSYYKIIRSRLGPAASVTTEGQPRACSLNTKRARTKDITSTREQKDETYFPTEALSGVGEGLRRHEGRRAGGAGQQSVVALELVADPEVGYLHVAVVAQQQVGGFDVPVDNLLVVH